MSARQGLAIGLQRSVGEGADLIEAVQVAGAVSSGETMPGVVPAEAGTQDFAKALEAGLGEDAGREHVGLRTRSHPGEVPEQAKLKSQGSIEKRTGHAKAVDTDAAGENTLQSNGPAEVAATGGALVSTQVVGILPAQLQGQGASTGADVASFVPAAVRAGKKSAATPVSDDVEGPKASETGPTVAEAGVTAWLAAKAFSLARPVKETEPVSSGSGHLQVLQGIVVEANAGVSHAPGKASVQNGQAGAASLEPEPVWEDEARVFEASSGALEVGVANATHGWLRVRAELDDGGAVVAQVMVGNAAAEGLHKELPGIAAYLAHEQVAVSSLVVHAAEAAAGAQDGAAGTTFSFSQGRGDRDATGGQPGSETSAVQGQAERLLRVTADATVGGLVPVPGLYAGGMNGGWLSVRV